MPIRPENKARYPADWPEISARVRQEAGQCCEWCNVPNGVMIRRAVTGVDKLAVYRLTDDPEHVDGVSADDGDQFMCAVTREKTEFPAHFISRYKDRWSILDVRRPK